MVPDRNKGNIYLAFAIALYIILLLGLVFLGLSGNAFSRSILELFGGKADLYLTILTILLFVALIAGLRLSRKALIYTKQSRISKVMTVVYRITIIGLIVAAVGTVIVVILMVMSGSLM